MRLVIVATSLIALLVGLAFVRATADTPAGAGRILHLSIASEPHSLLPIAATVVDEGALARLAFDTLVEFDDTNHAQPDLAAVVPTLANGGIAKDGVTITLHLRHDVKWQDGVPLTSADVAFTIHAILDPANNVANRSLYINVTSVDAPDPYTVVFHLAQPQASFLATVGVAYPILPKHLLEHSANLATDPFNAQPIGSGPYKLVHWARGDRLEYTANPTYFRGAPKIANLTVITITDFNTLGIQLRQHAIDFSLVDSGTFNTLRGAPDLKLLTEPFSNFNAVAMNMAHPILKDRRVRLALVKAIDRKTITRTVSFGTGVPAYGDLPLFVYGGHPPAGWDEADPAEARALLDAAGWKLGANGIREQHGTPLHLDMIGFSGSPTQASMALQLQQMLRAVGVDVAFKTYVTSLYFAPASAGGPLTSGNFDLATFGFQNGVDSHNGEIYLCASRIPHGFNVSNYCNPEMDRLQARSEREYDPALRDRIVTQIEDLAVHDAVSIFLYHTPYRIAQDPALKRPTASLDNQWYDIQDWTFTK